MSRALGLLVPSTCASPVKGGKASVVAAKDAENDRQSAAERMKLRAFMKTSYT
jgi:hypothetical protein